MFDFLQNLTKSAEEKRQETVAAYLDDVLNGRSRQQFEQEMAQDEALRLEVEQLLLIKQSLRQLPQREVPRNFILDPAEFAQRPPARQPWVQAYPVLRTATALAAFFFIFALAAGILTGFGLGGGDTMAPAADVAQVEEIETTAESFAFDVEEADGAADTAEDTMAAEADMFEEAEEEAMPADEDMADEAASDEAVEAEEAMDEEVTADEPMSEAPPAAAEDDAAPSPAATTLPLPTPTVSNLPRVTSPTPLPDRDLEVAQEAGDAANSAVVDEPVDEIPEPAVDTDTQEAETTLNEDIGSENLTEPISPLLWLQIGLGALLLLLVGLTFYARRQR